MFLEVISAGAAGVLTGGFYEGRRKNYEVGREIQCITRRTWLQRNSSSARRSGGRSKS
jgi:hypothetical protein